MQEAGKGAPGEGNALAGKPNLGGTAQKPALKWSRAQSHHLSRFISLPETFSPQNISPAVLCRGPAHCCEEAPIGLGHLHSLPGDLGSEDGDFFAVP